MMKPDEIIVAANGLRDFLRVGERMEDICMNLAQIQPQHAEAWKKIAAETTRGNQLGPLLTSYGLWPESLTAAVTAGEVANNLDAVLANVVAFVTDQNNITSLVKKKIISPIMFMGVGIAIFIGFMIGVIPGVTKGIPARDRSGMILVSDFFLKVWTHHLLTAGMVLAAVVVGFVLLSRSQATRTKFMQFFDSLPGLGDGIRSIWAGFWCRYMAILDNAGDVAFGDMVRISTSVTPPMYHPAYKRFLDEAESGIGPAEAANKDRWVDGDPRKGWPLRLIIALGVATSAGRYADSLGPMSNPLVEDGKAKVEKFLGYLNLLAMLIAALAIVAPMAMMMLIQIEQVQKMK